MGTMKTMMMDAGERNAILVYTDEAARWERLTGTQLIAIPMKLEASCSHYEWHPTLGCAAARRLLHDDRLPAADRDELRWRLEVAGLPTDPPSDSTDYTLGDWWIEFKDYALYVYPARLAPSHRATAVVASVANAIRRIGFCRAAMAVVGWEYERIDFFPIGGGVDEVAAWNTLRDRCPWAFRDNGRPAWWPGR
jgi:hypothetical protein